MTEDEPDYFCGSCGNKLRRIFTAPPVKFNGTGFYSTGGQMTDDEMQELCNNIVEGVEQYFETYDWDKAFIKYLEGK